MSHVVSLLTLGAVLLSWNVSARAQSFEEEPRRIEDRFRLEVGMLSGSFDTTLRVDSSAQLQGTSLNAEDDLGLSSSKLLPQVELTLLPGAHHLVRLSGLSIRRDGSNVLTRTIVFDDQVYLLGEQVESKLDLTMVGLTYGYRLIAQERWELAATFGIQISEVDANAVVRSRVLREAESGVAPLPLLGLEGRADISSRWSVEGRAQYLAVNISDVDGSLLDARLSATWRMNPQLTFGLGYRTFRLDVDSHSDSNPGKVSFDMSGPALFVRGSL